MNKYKHIISRIVNKACSYIFSNICFAKLCTDTKFYSCTVLKTLLHAFSMNQTVLTRANEYVCALKGFCATTTSYTDTVSSYDKRGVKPKQNMTHTKVCRLANFDKRVNKVQYIYTWKHTIILLSKYKRSVHTLHERGICVRI